VEGVVEIDPGGLRGDGNGWGFSLHSGRRDEGQNPRPVPPKNGGTRTGHPLVSRRCVPAQIAPARQQTSRV